MSQSSASPHRQLLTREWTTSRISKQVKVRHKGAYPYETTFVTANTLTDWRGEFEITIDLDGIAEELAKHAAYNKGGKASFLDGRCKGRRLSATALGEREKVNPLPDYFELIEDKPE